MINDMNSGLLPITTLVLNDLAMDTGQLMAKQSRKRTSQMLKSVIVVDYLIKKPARKNRFSFYGKW